MLRFTILSERFHHVKRINKSLLRRFYINMKGCRAVFTIIHSTLKIDCNPLILDEGTDSYIRVIHVCIIFWFFPRWRHRFDITELKLLEIMNGLTDITMSSGHKTKLFLLKINFHCIFVSCTRNKIVIN